MDSKLARAQDHALTVFSREATRFALAGGTALERYYLHHRFSWDLDFFAVRYDLKEVERIVSALRRTVSKRIRMESEFTAAGRARVRFYSCPIPGASRPLKIDFVEEVLIPKPTVRTIKGVRVYGAEDIYFQKLAAIAGIRPEQDATGRLIQEGRQEARDVFDLYWLSQKIEPLHQFLKEIPPLYQKGMVHWYRTFSRHDLKLGMLDIHPYQASFDSREMIGYLEKEITLFARGMADE